MTYWIETREGRGDVLCVALDEMSHEARSRVGIDFNPSGDSNIALAKAMCVGPMEMATRIAAQRGPMSGRAAATAATEFEKGQMLLVKAIAQQNKGE